MRILLVTTRPPLPPWRGNQLRALQWAEDLAERHTVTVLAPPPPAGIGVPEGIPWRWEPYRWRAAERAAGACAAVLVGAPFQNGLYRSADLSRRLDRALETGGHDLIILQLARLGAYARRVAVAGARALGAGAEWRGPRLAVDLVDALSLNLARRALRDRPILRPLLRLEARRMLAVERSLILQARRTWLVCERDRRHLVDAMGGEGVDRLGVVPVAVEAGAHRLEPPDRSSGFAADAPCLVLTGNLGYFPTSDGARFWLRRVWPEIRARWPRATLTVAGARPGRALRRAAAAAAGVRLLADPPDLGRLLGEADAAIVPLFAGSGVPIKLLEAWAAGTPVVATRWGAAGAGGKAGEDHLAADEPAEWLAALERLAREPDLAPRLAAAGRRRLERDHSREAVRAALWLAVEEAAGLR